MKLPLTPDEIARKLAVLPPERFERWLKEEGYTGMAAVALSRKVRRYRHEIAIEKEARELDAAYRAAGDPGPDEHKIEGTRANFDRYVAGDR